ncbi:DUF7260 family protein [Natronobeatus ordinarius]|uniref:DUF7260 family protein n=1 Tax=Natronobeatus ordinarius TaxID=2963433 RepID=UPI0020CDBCF7|nr:hypothetical protein [Natronobeatus ordinarius]
MSPEPSLDPFEEARLAIRAERRELIDEKQAFEAFLDRVKGLDVHQPSQTQSPLLATAPQKLDCVVDAYAETVATVPHYTDVYDEPILEHFAGELGVELAAAVTSGSQFHPELKRLLLEGSRQAITARERVLDLLETEADELERAERALTAVLEELESLLAQPLEQLEFNALRLTRVRLMRLETDCNTLAASRQSWIQNRQRAMILDHTDLGHYLYGECEHTYPALATIAEIGESIDRTRRQLDCRLSTAR